MISGEGNKVRTAAGSGLLAPDAGDKPEEEEARSCECRNGRGGGRGSRGGGLSSYTPWVPIKYQVTTFFLKDFQFDFFNSLLLIDN